MNAKSQLSEVTTRPGEKPEERVLRYYPAIRNRLYKYLPPPVADEVLSDIVVKIYEGKFDAWAPGKGKFHHYLAVSIDRAATDFFRRRKRQARYEIASAEAVERAAASDRMAAEFGQGVVEQVLRQMSRYQQTRNLNRKAGGRCGPNAYFTILRRRMKHPELSNEELIARLPWRFQKWFRAKPAAFRKQLQHARELFAALLVIEVAMPYQDIHAELPAAVGPALVQAVGRKLRERDWLQELMRELNLWPLVKGLCHQAITPE